MNKNEVKKQNKQEISSKLRKSIHAIVATKKNKTKIPSQKLKPVELTTDETVDGMTKTEFENYIGKILIANGFPPLGKIEVKLQHVWDCESTVYYSVEQNLLNYMLDPKTVNTTYQ